MKEKPPPDSIERTADLTRRLLSVPRHELERQERKWKVRRARKAAARQIKARV
jgi:hypothetical protein